MKTTRVVTVVGARPQFIKAAAVSRAFERFNAGDHKTRFEERIVHTGQHYDDNMSRVFFDELKLPRPHVNLAVGSALHGAQTAAMLERLEQLLLSDRPQWVLVYGDTNSTLAGALAAVKLHIPVAHVESGMRSFNRRMPEEINRVVVDSVSTLFFCATHTAVRNHRAEGVSRGVHYVGDVMYDSVIFHGQAAERSSTILCRLDLKPREYYLATIHRAENTDDRSRLDEIVGALRRLEVPVVWPMHPRTRTALGKAVQSIRANIRFIEPVSYLEMLMLEKHARIILTDSGGVQKEAYWFEVPCITLRNETEWVELVESGCNTLVGSRAESILETAAKLESLEARVPVNRPHGLYGDGDSAMKIVRVLAEVDGA